MLGLELQLGRHSAPLQMVQLCKFLVQTPTSQHRCNLKMHQTCRSCSSHLTCPCKLTSTKCLPAPWSTPSTPPSSPDDPSTGKGRLPAPPGPNGFAAPPARCSPAAPRRALGTSSPGARARAGALARAGSRAGGRRKEPAKPAKWRRNGLHVKAIAYFGLRRLRPANAQ